MRDAECAHGVHDTGGQPTPIAQHDGVGQAMIGACQSVTYAFRQRNPRSAIEQSTRRLGVFMLRQHGPGPQNTDLTAPPSRFDRPIGSPISESRDRLHNTQSAHALPSRWNRSAIPHVNVARARPAWGTRTHPAASDPARRPRIRTSTAAARSKDLDDMNGSLKSVGGPTGNRRREARSGVMNVHPRRHHDRDPRRRWPRHRATTLSQ